MKFDVVVGNPPYHKKPVGGNNRRGSIYNHFYELAEKISIKYCLISPARFLFNAGNTPKDWNEKMLNDKHLKVVYFNQMSSEVFPNTDIKGGIAILYRNPKKDFGEIGTFTSFEELNSIIHKVVPLTHISLDTIITGQGIYRFTQKAHENHPEVSSILPASHQFDISTGVFGTLNNILFFEQKPDDGEEYISMLGRYKSERVYRWIRKDYVNEPIGFDKWKVVLPKSNGTGAIGEKLSTPLIGLPPIGEPLIGHTQTFISIGAFDNELEAENCLKYIKSKFARTMLGVLKITQDNSAAKWKYVPLQDFTPQSDIDWTQSIADIDPQLYKKYNLDENEVKFIEEKIKEMRQ